MQDPVDRPIRRITGRTWVFPDANIDTDVIMPAASFGLPPAEQARHLFAPLRPGWAAQVRDGDIVVAGRNFGTGSSRPAAVPLAVLGVRAIVAESMSGLFLRNCVNHALVAAECQGVLGLVAEGDEITLDLRAGLLWRAGQPEVTIEFTPPPERLLRIIDDGGLEAALRRQGLVSDELGQGD